MDAHLTLEKAKTAIRQKEAVFEQQRELQGGGSAKAPMVVEEVRHDKKRYQKMRGSSNYKPQQPRGVTTILKGGPWMRCGKPRHATPDKCPARSAICHKCNRKGSQCLSKTRAAATQEVDFQKFSLG